MRNDRDTSVIERMIKYCEDVEVLLERFDRSFDNYTNDISFQYGVEISNWHWCLQMLLSKHKKSATGIGGPDCLNN